MSEFVDYYEILQVIPSADPDVIEKAYKALIFKHHPDRGGEEEEAKRITGAYYVLSDPQRREAHDRQRAGRERPLQQPEPGVDSPPPPSEVIDAILSATLREMVAATARDIGRRVADGADLAVKTRRAAAEQRADARRSVLRAEAAQRHNKRRALEDELEAQGIELSARAVSWLMDVSTVVDPRRSIPFKLFRDDEPMPKIADLNGLVRQRAVPRARQAISNELAECGAFAVVGMCPKCGKMARMNRERSSTCCHEYTKDVSVVSSEDAIRLVGKTWFDRPGAVAAAIVSLGFVMAVIGLLAHR